MNEMLEESASEIRHQQKDFSHAASLSQILCLRGISQRHAAADQLAIFLAG